MKRHPLFHAMMLVAATVIADIAAVAAAGDTPVAGSQAANVQASNPQPPIADIVAQQRQLRGQAVAKKGAFKDISERDRKDLIAKQDEVLGLLDGVSAIDELRADQRVVVFNDLEWIKAFITKAEDERKICEYTQTVGSHRPRSVCLTSREWEQLRERARSTMNRPGVCNESPAACGNETAGGGIR